MQAKKDDIIPGKFLESCDISSGEKPIAPFTMVIFGGTGDLSRRKLLPTLFHLFREKKLPRSFSIIAFGRQPDFTDMDYRKLIRSSLEEFTPELCEKEVFSDFCSHLYYSGGLFENDESYIHLRNKIQGVSTKNQGKITILFYMAVPPSLLPLITDKLGANGLNGKGDGDENENENGFNSRIIVEKPFGTDRESAGVLNRKLHSVFEENQIFRIDHYLGKETVQNIIFLRFSNSIFEPLWNRSYIDSVQITVAESLGIEHRGRFYEEAGVIRDIVQNHLLQLVALVAMEPPIGFGADLIRDEKVKVFKSITAMTDEYIDENTVQGQYDRGLVEGKEVNAYREEKNVDPASTTPTFFAAKFLIDNWRWAGVPFYVQTGKRLQKRQTQIVIRFKKPPLQLFGKTCESLDPSCLVLTIQPEEEIILHLNVKYPNSINRVKHIKMDFSYTDRFNTKSYPAYSRLILDCLKGDLTLFVREDGINALWSIVDPIIKRWEKQPPKDFPNYKAGSWGPAAAHKLLEKEGHCWFSFCGDGGV